jgi:hypothetical protein
MQKVIDLNELFSNPGKIEEISVQDANNILVQVVSALPLLISKTHSSNGRATKAIPDEYLTIEQASNRFNKSEDYFYRNAKKLPFMKKDEGGWRISVNGYERYFEKL